MNKKLLLSGFLMFMFAVAFAAAAIIYTRISYPPRQTGGLVFAETYRRGSQIDQIRLTFHDQKNITFLLENNFWVIREADYYYANMEFLNLLIRDLNLSEFYHRQQSFPDNVSQNNEVLIETFAQGQNLDHMVISAPAANPAYHFAHRRGEKETWLISGKFNLPPETYSWIMQPLLNYPPQMIEAVSLDGETLNRRDPRSLFTDSQNRQRSLNPLLDQFSYLIAQDVLSAQNFDETAFKKLRQISATTFSGLVTTLDLLSNGRDYWLKITLSATTLPTHDVNAYIRDNTFLYDGWFFKIAPATGKLLENFKPL